MNKNDGFYTPLLQTPCDVSVCLMSPRMRQVLESLHKSTNDLRLLNLIFQQDNDQDHCEHNNNVQLQVQRLMLVASSISILTTFP